jgi:thermitase
MELEKAINYAWAKGVVVVAAAGSNRGMQLTYPASYENCIAVTATMQDDTLAPLSNYGDWVDVAAPGFDIYSTLPGNNYGYKSGTSFATAYVSGLAALLFDITADINGNGRLNDEIKIAIESGYRETDASGTGIGIMDAIGSLSLVDFFRVFY